jgi:hypothetical protein
MAAGAIQTGYLWVSHFLVSSFVVVFVKVVWSEHFHV